MGGTFIDRFGTGGLPAYIRKLDKKSTWGNCSDDPGERVAKTVRGVFPPAEPLYSFFLARSDEDLNRVVAALNGSRLSPNNKIDFVAFTEEELLGVGVKILDSPGDTDCKTANSLHVDVQASDHSAYSCLCQKAFATKRKSFRISKPEAKKMWQKLEKEGCEAIDGNTDCECI